MDAEALLDICLPKRPVRLRKPTPGDQGQCEAFQKRVRDQLYSIVLASCGAHMSSPFLGKVGTAEVRSRVHPLMLEIKKVTSSQILVVRPSTGVVGAPQDPLP